MPDRILIKNLLVRGIIGIKADERVKRQDILLNLSVACDTRPAAVSDDIADALNYRTLTKDVIRLVEASSFHTVERLAEEVARLAVGHGGREVTVLLEKPGALRFAESVGVEITRTADDFRSRG